MINLPSRQTWSPENFSPSIVHMRHCDLNWPDTLGLCVAIRRADHTIPRAPTCILDCIVSHRERPGSGSADELDLALMDDLSLSNPYYWIYMPMSRGERVSEMWVRYKLAPGGSIVDGQRAFGLEEVLQGVVVSQVVPSITTSQENH